MAMEATELMVGDLVNIKGKPVKVTLDDLRTMLILFEDVDFHIEPIELTEYILVKNGFYRSPRWHYCEITTDDGFKIYVQLGYAGTIDYVRITKHNSDLMERDIDATVIIHYVHELQHLLHLCGTGKELTI